MFLDENTLKEIIIAAIQARGEGISISTAIQEAVTALIIIDKKLLQNLVENRIAYDPAISFLAQKGR